ncbi:MAG: hypothetical protein KVP17_001179 [Porospora cf. gigantea B]|uniref:uncharacterized protein n=1 Tax=Porospora cf. gigantea B TaxID=2853592 RepID=UPI0035719ECF|nr:MAG: hypothetical protein KVP17_001179 [Porospora cf. gigantea B]
MISITLEEQNLVDLADRFETGRAKVTVTYSPEETERWVRRNLTALPKNAESWIVGLDTESVGQCFDRSPRILERLTA